MHDLSLVDPQLWASLSPAEQRILRDHASLWPEMKRLRAMAAPVPGAPAPPPEQLDLVARHPSEGRVPRRPRGRRGTR